MHKDHQAFNQHELKKASNLFRIALGLLRNQPIDRAILEDIEGFNSDQQNDGDLYKHIDTLSKQYNLPRSDLEFMALAMVAPTLPRLASQSFQGLACDNEKFTTHTAYFANRGKIDKAYTKSILKHELAKPKSRIRDMFKRYPHLDQQDWIARWTENGFTTNSAYRITGLPTNLRKTTLKVNDTAMATLLLHGTPWGHTQGKNAMQERDFISASIRRVVKSLDEIETQQPFSKPILTHVRQLSPSMFNVFEQDQQWYQERAALQRINHDRQQNHQPPIITFNKPVNTLRLLSVEYSDDYVAQKQIIAAWVARLDTWIENAGTSPQASTFQQQLLALAAWLQQADISFAGTIANPDPKILATIGSLLDQHDLTYAPIIKDANMRYRLGIQLRALIELRVNNQRSIFAAAMHRLHDAMRAVFYKAGKNPAEKWSIRIALTLALSPVLLLAGLFRLTWHLFSRRWCPLWRCLKSAQLKGNISKDPDIMGRIALLTLGFLLVVLGIGLLFSPAGLAMLALLFIGLALACSGLLTGFPLNNKHLNNAANIMLLSDGCAAGCKSGRDRTEWVVAKAAHKATDHSKPKPWQRNQLKGGLIVGLSALSAIALMALGLGITGAAVFAFPFLVPVLIVLIIGIVMLVKQPTHQDSRKDFIETLEAVKTTRKGCGGNQQIAIHKTVCLFTPEDKFIQPVVEGVGLQNGEKGFFSLTTPSAKQKTATSLDNSVNSAVRETTITFQQKSKTPGRVQRANQETIPPRPQQAKPSCEKDYTITYDHKQKPIGRIAHDKPLLDPKSTAIAMTHEMVDKIDLNKELFAVVLGTHQDGSLAWQEALGICSVAKDMGADVCIKTHQGRVLVDTEKHGWQFALTLKGITNIRALQSPPAQATPSSPLE